MSNTHRPEKPDDAILQLCLQLHAIAVDSARRSGANSQDVMDCAGDCFLYLFQEVSSGAHPANIPRNKQLLEQHAITYCGSWVRRHRRRMARFAYIDAPNSVGVTQEGLRDMPSQKLLPEEGVLRCELVQRVYAVIQMLTPEQQLLFHLVCVDSKTITEVADILGISPRSSTERVRRLKHSLQRYLAQAGLTVEEATEYLKSEDRGAN